MKKAFTLTAAAAFGIAGSAMAGGGSLVVDLGGLTSNGFQNGGDGNVTIATGLSGVTITSVDYNINATANQAAASWFQEMTYSLWDGAVGGTLLADGSNGDLSYSPGSMTSGFVNSIAVGSHDIADVFTTGLVIELHEWDFDDIAGPDAFYNSGSSLTINYVPAPAGLAVLGLFGLARRRRR